jgi:RNA polymerase sigma-70 factor (sigma-E family)
MRTDIDEEFADYVRARQWQLLRAAFLVCGDRHLAEDVLQQALLKLALRWHRIRSEDPDTYVRRTVYRAAISAWRRSRREPLDPLGGDRIFADEPSGTAARVGSQDALFRVPPKQRAVLVLRFFEDRTEADTAEVLGLSEGTVTSQAHAAMAQLPAAHDLGTLLDDASDHLPEIDFGEAAWAGAVQTRRQRRRTVVGSLVAVLAAAVAAVGIGLLDRPGRENVGPAPTPPPTEVRYKRTFTDVLYTVAPEVGSEASLRRLDSGLPRVLPREGTTPPTWEWPADRPVVAVTLRHLLAEGGSYAVVVLGPGGIAVQVPDLVLAPTREADGGMGLPLSSAAVSPDGRMLVFAQPGRVILFTVPTGELHSARVPTESLERAGWGVGGAMVIASSESDSWVIDPASLEVHMLPRRAPAGRYSIDGSGVPRPFLQTWSANGQYLGGMPLALPPGVDGQGDTVDNGLGWAGRAALLTPDVPSSVDGGRPGQGLVAVQAGLDSSLRLLLFGRSSDRPSACCQAVGWKGHILLFTSASAGGRVDLLGWDVGSGEVLRVAEMSDDGLALGPGATSGPPDVPRR